MATHRTIIITSPYSVDFNPKKTTDHRAFNASCVAKIYRAVLFSFFSKPFPQTRYREIPISMYRVSHTGPKSQFGGAKLGFTNVAYQDGIDCTVKIEPITPASWQITIAAISLPIFSLVIA